MGNYDFIAIGDTATDAFIRLKDADTHSQHGSKELCVRYGDKIEYEFVEILPAVGNSANAAVSAARLGLKSALVASIGNDENGKQCLEALNKNEIGTNFIHIEKGKLTNYHYVLWFGAERTILIKHESYDYRLPDIGEPKWIYLSSIAEHAIPYQHTIARYIEKHPNIKLAFQPGTFQIKKSDELADLYKLSELFFCNKEEAQRILNITPTDIQTLLKLLHERGPKIVCITDGPKGAYVYDGNDMWFMPMYPDSKPPYERTGAGDAFASTFTSALALGLSIPEAISWAPINSMSVVQYVGAQKGLLTRTKLEAYLEQAPREYKAQKI